MPRLRCLLAARAAPTHPRTIRSSAPARFPCAIRGSSTAACGTARPSQVAEIMTRTFFQVVSPSLSLLLLGGLTACSPGRADAAEIATREVNDLVTALTPPPLTALPIEKSQYFV